MKRVDFTFLKSHGSEQLIIGLVIILVIEIKTEDRKFFH